MKPSRLTCRSPLYAVVADNCAVILMTLAVLTLASSIRPVAALSGGTGSVPPLQARVATQQATATSSGNIAVVRSPASPAPATAGRLPVRWIVTRDQAGRVTTVRQLPARAAVAVYVPQGGSLTIVWFHEPPYALPPARE